MIARILPGSVDVEGKPVSRPRKKHFFRPTFPIEAYLTQPLAQRCSNLDQIRAFLSTCRYVHDKELFDVDDYWTPPEEFEKSRRGDCDCAAIWAWRQLIDSGFEARYVVGESGPHRTSHAWVFFKQGDDWFALEPFRAWVGARFPQLHTLWYRPRFSVSWDGSKISYFEHTTVDHRPRTTEIVALSGESAWYALRIRALKLRFSARLLRRRIRRVAGGGGGVIGGGDSGGV